MTNQFKTLLFLLITILLVSCYKQTKLNTIDKKVLIRKSDTTIYYNDSNIILPDSFISDMVGSSGNNTLDTFSYTAIEMPKKVRKLKSNKNKLKPDFEIEEPKEEIIPSDDNIGKVVYQVPDTMKIFTNYRITVRITKEQKISKNIIEERLNISNGSIKESTIQTTSKMEVTFKDESTEDDPSFIISKINNDQQIIDGNYTEWIFNVKPIKHGDKKLNLIISIIKDDNKKQIVYTDTIYVRDSITLQIKLFWFKYWQYLISTFIIPIFIFIWKRRKSKRIIYNFL
jgi:hypothetical protein